MESTYGGTIWGMLKKWQTLYWKNREEEQLFPLFEEVFGITSQTLQIFQRKVLGLYI